MRHVIEASGSTVYRLWTQWAQTLSPEARTGVQSLPPQHGQIWTDLPLSFRDFLQKEGITVYEAIRQFGHLA